MVVRGGAMVMVMVMVMVKVVAAGESAEIDNCSKMKVLGNECNEDEGPQEPSDGQVVYLGHPREKAHWWYPKHDTHVSYWEHPTRTITDTEDRWASWLWRDCNDGYVCLESVKYPHYYLGYVPNNLHAKYVYYSGDPKSDDKLRVKPIDQETAASKIPRLVRLGFKGNIIKSYLEAYLYIPPRCEGVRQVLQFSNPHSTVYNYKYKFETGVSRSTTSSNTKSHTKTVSVSMGSEVLGAILAAALGGSFTSDWTNSHTITKGISTTESNSHEITFAVQAGQSITLFQKVAIYGEYELKSNTFIPCEKNLTQITSS